MAVPDFSSVVLYEIETGAVHPFTVPAGKIWKIESVGIGGTKGTVYLHNNEDPPAPIAILFSTIDNNDYGADLPFWLPAGFEGELMNDSRFKAAVSITEYTV